MILLLNILLLISLKIKEQRISYYYTGFIIFFGLTLSAIGAFNIKSFSFNVFSISGTINYLLLYIWSLVFVNFCIKIKNKEQIKVDWESFALINLAVIQNIPIALVLVILVDFIFSYDINDIDYKKGRLHFLALYAWLILCVFGKSFDHQLFLNSLDISTIALMVGLLFYLLKSFSLKKISYSIAILALVREMLSEFNSELTLYVELAICFSLAIWSILILGFERYVLVAIKKYSKIEQAFLKINYNFFDTQSEDIKLIEFKQNKGRNPKRKIIKIKNVVENDIRFNMVLILLLLNILIGVFHFGVSR